MLIKLFDNNRLLAVLDDESKMLGFYPVDNLHVLKVIDNDPYRPKNEYLDVSNVEKYEISEKDYEKRQDTVRNFLKQNKLGKFSEKEAVTSERLYSEYQGKIKVGDRCLVTLDTFPKRGTVQYFGETEFKPGFWVGVEYDEPVGKHNGTVQGKQYFTCSDKYGAFVRPDKCEIGDFPPLDIEDEIEEM
jgi:tubulin-folding cofactor B